MPRIRLGVVLLIREPVATEINGLRRALDDGSIDRISPHITLVSPVNVNVEELGAALDIVRNAAYVTRPLTLRLGPVSTFMPDTPVIKLDVSGDAIDKLHQLRHRVFVDALERPMTWPFVPHATLADEADPDRIAHALQALRSYVVNTTFDRIHVLQEDTTRVWRPIADYAFREPAVVGRGGLPLELSVTSLIDPIAAELLEAVPRTDLVVTARRNGEVVGLAGGLIHGDDAQLLAIVVRPDVRRQGIGSHLLTHFMSEAAHRGVSLAVLGCSNEEISEAAGFFEKHNFAHGCRAIS